MISVKLPNPQFEGQTKGKLGNTSMRSLVQKTTNEALADWLEEHPREAKKSITRAAEKIRSGYSTLLFPEGGRTRTEPERHAVPDLQRHRFAAQLPPSAVVEVLIRVVRVQRHNVHVCGVRPAGGHGPGELRVVPEADVRRAGQADTAAVPVPGMHAELPEA